MRSQKGNAATQTHRGCGGQVIESREGPLVCESCGANINLDSQIIVSRNPGR